MINGLYSSAAGMRGQLEQQDAISNNLANVNTSGYKRVSVGFSAFSNEMAAASRSTSPTPSQEVKCIVPVPFTAQDLSQGVIQSTTNPTNLAIDGSGYFVVSNGKTQELTRSGSFKLDSNGRLSTTDGRAVLGQNGPIRISGTKWDVDPDGSVRVDGVVTDKLLIKSGSVTRAAEGSAFHGRILQGQLEGSNVSVVKEMVNMLTALRSYEANQKTIQALDQTLEKIINLPGRVA